MLRLVQASALLLSLAGCAAAGPEPERCVGLAVGDLVVTELLVDPEGHDLGSEWIEVFNRSSAPIELSGVTIYVQRLDGWGRSTHRIAEGTVPSRGYFVLREVPPLSNSEGVVGLSCLEADLDVVRYSRAGREGRARSLDGRLGPDARANDDEARWCEATTATVGMLDFGTPGAANPECTTPADGTCTPTGGNAQRPVVLPRPGQVFFTEVMADPTEVFDVDGEWLELRSNAAVDLNGLLLTVGSVSSSLSSPECLFLSAGSHAVLAHTDDEEDNGGLPWVLALFDQTLGNSGATVSLSLQDGGSIDVARYDAALPGEAWQLDPRRLDAAANDDPASFCPAWKQWVPDGGDLGTPAALNSDCTPGAVAECLDGMSGLMRSVVSPLAGDLVITELMADPTKVLDAVGEYIEILGNAAFDLNGLVLANESGASSTLSAATCMRLPAGGRALFARSADPQLNGGLPPVAGTFDFSLANTGPRSVEVSSGGTVLDTFSYADATPGASTQLKPGLTSPAANDVAANVCVTPSARYGMQSDGGPGDRGTPGRDNEACP